MGIGRLFDRTAVLFIGIGVGASIGQAFAYGGSTAAASGAPIAAAAVTTATATASAPMAAAQQSCPTDIRLAPRLVAAMREGREIHIGVFGDSFGQGLWTGLYNALRPQDEFTVHSFGKQATGFTRYRNVNLLDDVREQIAEQPVEIAVVSYGANDTFDIYEGQRLLPYMGEQWRAYISEKVRAYVDRLQRDGTSVIWVGLPRMRDSEFDGKVQQMNSFYAGLMCELNVPFINTLPYSVDRAGAYTDYLPGLNGGEPFKGRTPDGIHMTATGYRILMTAMIASISQLAPPAGDTPTPPETGPTPRPAR